jgi:carboxyl-terminal processing protease
VTLPELIPDPWHGRWRSVGYNKVLEIGAAGYSSFSTTAGHACLFEQGSPSQFADAFDRLELTSRHRLALFHAHDLTRYEFERHPGWDVGCRLHLTPCADPLVNFDAFCQVFAENYAFFELRGVDWAQLCAAGGARLSAAPSAEMLEDTIDEMIAPLSDIHVHVTAQHRKLRSMQTARGPRRALQAAFDLPTPALSARTTVDRIGASMRQTLLSDYQSTLIHFTHAGNEAVAWGTLCPGIGYLNLLRMFGYAATDAARHADDLPHRLYEAGPFMAADMSRLEKILDEAIAALAHLDALIVDLRLNGGGFDRAGMLLCERLTAAPVTVFRKKAKRFDGFTQPQSITTAPARAARFTKPVFVLISPFTQSAGEVCALAMSALPNVTLLGEPTQGILSDNLFHRLPSGWEVSLSNEVYETPDGRCFEAVGVPPNELLPALTEENLIGDLRAGLRIAVDRATGR